MQTAPTGVTDRAVLTRLLTGRFLGSAPELAAEIRCQERFVWVAIAGLAERDLVKAERTASGILRLTITRAGRQAQSANQRKYAPTAKERKQGRVSFA